MPQSQSPPPTPKHELYDSVSAPESPATTEVAAELATATESDKLGVAATSEDRSCSRMHIKRRVCCAL